MVNNGNGNNGISKKREETAARIIKALKETNGLLTMAATKAGIGYRTVCRYVAEFPSVEQAAQDAKEAMLDLAESKLYSKIRDGDNTAIIFYLKTQGKNRGYIERHEVGGEGGGAIKVEVDGKGKLISAINRLASRAGEAESDKQPES